MNKYLPHITIGGLGLLGIFFKEVIVDAIQKLADNVIKRFKRKSKKRRR